MGERRVLACCSPPQSYNIVTEKQNNDVVFYDNGKEYGRVNENGPWKLQTPASELKIAPANTIIFNTKETNEIAKFTEEGFYYKNEFIEDAGEIYRLLKDVLFTMKAEQSR